MKTTLPRKSRLPLSVKDWDHLARYWDVGERIHWYNTDTGAVMHERIKHIYLGQGGRVYYSTATDNSILLEQIAAGRPMRSEVMAA